jgi:hypothetical protein
MTDPTLKVCGNCHHAGKDGHGTVVECRRFPPQVVFLPVAAPTVAGAKPLVDWLTNGIYPWVRADRPSCGEFRPAAEIVN